ncbi:MAG: sodium:proton exchanger [Desulforhopalus sp.]|nr:sodium:proton exchanger [Desulforhopalus sp.]
MNRFLKNSLGLLDIISWSLVLLFFCGSALFNNGNLAQSTIGAVSIIVVMFIITLAIEICIECLKNTKGIGTITGFITNGPEAVVLVVGLINGDIIFAASTPLGSNFINPPLLFTAALICHNLIGVVNTRSTYSFTTYFFTAFLAGSFFFLDKSDYIYWLGTALTLTLILFFIRPKEEVEEHSSQMILNPKIWLVPAIALLVSAGYLLDPVVSYAATASKAPKGVIGFLVLSLLTSWPEFKSCIALLHRNNPLAAILNITVSNITNIWLAAAGLVIYVTGRL